MWGTPPIATGGLVDCSKCGTCVYHAYSGGEVLWPVQLDYCKFLKKVLASVSSFESTRRSLTYIRLIRRIFTPSLRDQPVYPVVERPICMGMQLVLTKSLNPARSVSGSTPFHDRVPSNTCIRQQWFSLSRLRTSIRRCGMLARNMRIPTLHSEFEEDMDGQVSPLHSLIIWEACCIIVMDETNSLIGFEFGQL